MNTKINYKVNCYFIENSKSFDKLTENSSDNYKNLDKINTHSIIRKDTNKQLNKYGLLKLNYIKNYKKSLYQELKIRDELNNFIFSVGNEAQEKFNYLMNIFIKNDKELTEKLKGTNQILWLNKMNNYKNIAEEIVLNEYIYN